MRAPNLGALYLVQWLSVFGLSFCDLRRFLQKTNNGFGSRGNTVNAEEALRKIITQLFLNSLCEFGFKIGS